MPLALKPRIQFIYSCAPFLKTSNDHDLTPVASQLSTTANPSDFKRKLAHNNKTGNFFALYAINRTTRKTHQRRRLWQGISWGRLRRVCSRDYGYGEATTTKFVRVQIDPIANEKPEDTFQRFEDARKSFNSLPGHGCIEVKCLALLADSFPPAVKAMIERIRGISNAENADKARESIDASIKANQNLPHDPRAKNSACK